MTIALVIPALPTYSETFLTNKIKGLKESGFNVVIMVVGESEKRKMDVPVHYQPILAASGPLRWMLTFWLIVKSMIAYPKKSIKLLREASKAGYEGFGTWRMLAVLSNFLKIKPDWVHFAYGTMAVERAFIGKVLGSKVSLSLRGYDITIFPILNPGIYDKVWPYVDKVHSISRDLLKAAYKQNMPISMSKEIIYPAIDVENFNSTGYRKWNDKPHFLTVSRLHWKKGLEYTLQALALLDFDFRYTIIGEGADYERLVFAAYQLGIADKVSFAGKKAQDEVKTAMQNQDVYIQYSLQEGFCNSVLEAQASGMLCLVSDAEGLTENVLDGETGWVIEKRKVLLLAERIAQTVALPNFIKDKISKQSAQRAVKEFNIKKQKVQFESFYNHE